ncbi:hypothetical protein O181_091576 [Austropuccinia psidii MF-1]|uniref:Uncharacterized protein n=1 Tax=Austropuccinia psidii MF-1 TaxID=1389203 RepID=A0A9Q3IXQ2_9BASI|nr:hypothetical protein [Austropuccinia psidii MF-1]
MENTDSEVSSGNTTVSFSLESILSPTCKPNTLKDYSKEINVNTIKNNSNPGPNQPYTNITNIYDKQEQNLQPNTSCTNSNTNKIELSTIDMTATKNKEKTISNKKDTSNLIDTTVNKETEPKYKITNSTKTTIDMTITKNEEETIFNKIVNYIERKIKNQPISTKERVSTTLRILPLTLKIKKISTTS